VIQPLDLNLSSRPFRNNTLLWAAHVAACGSLLAFSVWNVSTFLEEGRALKSLEGQSSQIERKMGELDLRAQRAEAGIARHDLKDLGVQSATANGVILMKALSWTRLFNLLETVVPYEVKTVSIRPAFGSSFLGASDSLLPQGAVPVSIQGIAQSLEAFLEFERALIVDRHFDQVEPEKTDFLPGAEVAFEVGFLYYPDGRKLPGEVPELPHVLAAAAEEPAALEEPMPEVEEQESAGAPVPAAGAPVARPGAAGVPPAGRGTPPRVRPPGGKGRRR
jgi:Tfp pilus assembly protein PilN